MNILSFDIEEWYLEKILHGGRELKYHQYDEALDKLLAELDKFNLKATFFCVGKLAIEFPEVIEKIAFNGHEIGCHSNEHTWLTKMDEATLRKDTREAVKSLEDVCGQKVVSYRAPAFSISERNKWALAVLTECGIERDFSIFPAARDFGGYPSFPQDKPCLIRHRGVTIKEYPIGVTTICGRRMAYSGGGYFRLIPYGWVKRTMNSRDYNICYFHLNDLIDQRIKMMSRKEYEEYFNEPGTLKNRLTRYAKSNIGTGDGYAKLSRLMGDIGFTSLREADGMIDWDKVNVMEL